MRKVQRILKLAWVGIRFVVFGLGGLWGMSCGVLSFLQGVFEHPHIEKGGGTSVGINPMLSLLLGLLGTVMILFGVGEMKRWRYSFVFLSLPVSLYASARLLSTFPVSQRQADLLIVAVMAICAFGIHAAVRRFYKNVAGVESSPTERGDTTGQPHE